MLQSQTIIKWHVSNGIPGGADSKASTYDVEDPGSFFFFFFSFIFISWRLITLVLSLGWKDPLEKEMATHSNTLAWKIPCTEEPGRLQSTGLQRVGHD